MRNVYPFVILSYCLVPITGRPNGTLATLYYLFGHIPFHKGLHSYDKLFPQNGRVMAD